MKPNLPWLSLFGICLASFLGCIDFTIVNTALPAIQQSFNASVSELQWIINGFMLALTAFMVIAGRLSDIYGHRLWLFIGLITFALASLGAGLSTNLYLLVAFRVLQGFGIAILYTVPVSLVAYLFPENMRGKATGILIGANGFGLAIGPVIGGILVSTIGWRSIFLINIPIIITSILICFLTLPESQDKESSKPSLDWPGFILLMIAAPALIFGTAEGNTLSWSSPIILFSYGIALAAGLIFYWVEEKSGSPIIEFHLFSNRTLVTGLIANFSLAFFYCVTFFLIPLYFHLIREESAFIIGLMLLPITLAVGVLSPVVGSLVDRVGIKKVLLIGFCFFTLSAALQLGFNEKTSLAFIFVSFISMGIGWACILSPSIVATVSSVPEKNSGVAMGTLGTLHNFGGALGLALGTMLYHTFAERNLLSQNLHLENGLSGLISDPQEALQFLPRETVNQFFLSGYHSAMVLLVFVSIAAFTCIYFGLKKKMPGVEKNCYTDGL